MPTSLPLCQHGIQSSSPLVIKYFKIVLNFVLINIYFNSSREEHFSMCLLVRCMSSFVAHVFKLFNVCSSSMFISFPFYS